MARYVIDAPTLVHLLDRGLDIDPGHQLVAPNALRSEALGLLFHDVREGNRTEKEALHLHELITEQEIRLLGDRVSRRTAWQIARERGWESLHAAEYVAVAQLQADALVTVDPRLASQAKDVVPVAPVDAL